ncbi:hypothetical protein P6166_14585 [Stenotrophomonas sp. HITSZ_GD]|uniref:hypothetical protein n=1 Tax=Stenotrophomonas sp. HITSZ_GD TaxID=3037248 RepID=UPI00240D48E3|nr:hypothetical protein [Stenotrophomonas sp. HITSZ_GD]MDG2526581.1 hypothetical protein [Stenotrophomonas sp. HITSZ_GD]
MMRLFAKLIGGRVHGLGSPSPKVRASARPPVSFSQELADAIEAAIVSVRESNDEGARVMVMCHALRGAFIFDCEEAARRIRLAFPGIDDASVKRGVRHLESHVCLAAAPERRDAKRRPSWVHGWMER